MSEVEVPLKPLGREDIQKLEAVLLLGTVSRQDVKEKMQSADPKDRITWIDSLAVAAGALAREKAGLSVPRIAEELGRSEQTVRFHLTGKTEAGKLTRETYEMLTRGEKILSFLIKDVEKTPKEGAERLEKAEIRQKLVKLQEEVEKIQKTLKEVIDLLA